MTIVTRVTVQCNHPRRQSPPRPAPPCPPPSDCRPRPSHDRGSRGVVQSLRVQGKCYLHTLYTGKINLHTSLEWLCGDWDNAKMNFSFTPNTHHRHHHITSDNGLSLRKLNLDSSRQQGSRAGAGCGLVSALYLLFIYSISTVYLLYIYCKSTMYLLCIYCISTVYIQCNYCVSPVYLLYIYCVSTMYLLYIYSVSTVYLLCI